MPSSLRTYLKDIKKETIRIKKEVDPKTQLGDLVSQSDRPLLFENLTGFPGWKICDLLIKTRTTQAIALKTTPDQIVPELSKRIVKGPGKTRTVKSGPVKAKKVTKVHKIRGPVISSSRRFKRNGVISQLSLNTWLVLLDRCPRAESSISSSKSRVHSPRRMTSV